MTLLMSKDNNILWTATHISLPKSLWSRLEGLGYKVLVADGDDNPLSKIQKLSPRLWVDKINGEPDSDLSPLQDIRSKYPDLPIIIVSSRPCVEDAVRAIKMGATDYIPADISQERLWATLEGALENRAFIGLSQTHRIKNNNNSSPPIAVHHSMCKIMNLAKKIAPSRSTILIQGESGTGKEVVAQYIHKNSRKTGPFIAVNCAALPENLLESELFGHERGAFTGAVSRRKGKFELANEGTLLLDEISEMAVSIQAKLLRVLQERHIDRVGGQFVIPVDVRVIATTNRNLEEETKKGNFRLDLFYRLNVVPLTLPPLRKRMDDIIPLANFFLKIYCSLNNIETKKLSPEAEDFLKQKSWSGNVRELENLMERTTLLVESKVIKLQDMELISNPEGQTGFQEIENDRVLPLKELERKMIFHALKDNNGNRTHASKILGISVRTLRNKLHEYKKESDTEEVPAQD